MRNSLGIITTPRIDIEDFATGSSVSYENTEFEKVVDAVVKSIKSHKLLCIDLYNSGNNFSLFGLVNILQGADMFMFECGGTGTSNGEKYFFYIELVSKTVSIELVEL